MNDDIPTSLSGVLNSFISSVSKGRHASDLEAMRMALIYNKIDLLRGLPVPRLRISDVKISLPVIINGPTMGSSAILKTTPEIIEVASASLSTEIKESLNWVRKGLKWSKRSKK